MVKVLSHINAFGLKKGEVGELSEVDGMEAYFKAGYLERIDDVEIEPKPKKARTQKVKGNEPETLLLDDGEEGD